MDLDVRPPSLVLPGAWSPAWTQSLDRDPSDMSVASPNSSGGSLRLEMDFSLDQADRFDPQNGVLVSKASTDNAAAASDSDEESTLSDDFYSIISDQVSQLLLLILIYRTHIMRRLGCRCHSAYGAHRKLPCQFNHSL